MQAIETRYLGPTNFRGARVKALCEAGRVVVAWDDGLDVAGNHDVAARVLIKKLGWNDGRGRWVRGGLPKSRGYVYVLDTKHGSERIALPRVRKAVRS
jgi:hypothetical protein